MRVCNSWKPDVKAQLCLFKAAVVFFCFFLKDKVTVVTNINKKTTERNQKAARTLAELCVKTITSTFFF